MSVYKRIEALRNERGISQGKLEKELGFSNGSISKWKNSTPTFDRLKKIADYFDVSVDYLMTGKEALEKKEVSLTPKDERDIAKRLEDTLADLESNQEALMFSGEPLDDETRELLKASLENSIRIAKINAKQKFTPKKYRKE